ncbi:MAG: phage tail tape measure protein, partial [Anaerolineae bacterium]|nr:phage tail tape measure protein [Anaerolineae bacterium]
MTVTVADLEVIVGADTSEAETKLDSLSGKIRTSEGDIRAASMAFIGAGLAIAGGLGMAVMAGANFEKTISGIGAVSGLTQQQLDQVRQAALQLGSQTAFSAAEAAQGMDTLLKAGMPLEQVLSGGAKAALDLAAAAGTDVPTAATLLTSAMNVFGASAGSAADAANSFNAAANFVAADSNSLVLGFSMAALPAKMMGLSLNDLNTALALFSQNGLQGSDAGTSFKTMLLAMANPTKEQKALMDQLGLSFFDAQGNFVGLEGAASALQAALSGMSESQRTATLAQLFGNDAVRAASILYSEGAAGIAAMRTEMASQQTAAEQAAARMNNFAGTLETLKGTLETASIIVAGSLTPALQSLAQGAQGVVSWFNQLSPQTQDLIGKGLALSSGLLMLTGALGMASTALGPLAAGFSMLTGPIGLVSLALAGLFVAYQTNFLGFADGVNAALSWMQAQWPAVQSAIETAAAAIAGAWQSMASAFQAHKATIDAVINGVKALFEATWPVIAKTISDQIEGIKTAFAGLVTALSGLATSVSGILSLIKAVVTLDFGGMRDAVVQIVEGLRTTVEG